MGSNEDIRLVSNQLLITSSFKKSTLEECIEYLSNLKEIAIDTETEGLFNHSNKIIMLQVGDNQRQYIIDVRNVDISPLRSILENPNIVKVLQNASFDYKFLRMYNIMLNNIWDTQIAEMILTTGLDASVSLATIAKRYLDIDLDKTVRTTFNKKTTEFTDSQIIYGAYDIKLLLDIKKKQLDLIIANGLENTLSLENLYVDVLGDIEYNGFYLDAEEWLKLNLVNKENLSKCRATLDNYIFTNNIEKFIDSQIDLFREGKVTTINWDSPIQVIKFLEHIDIDTTVIEKGVTKKSSDAKHLGKHRKHPFVSLYLEYKKVDKEVSTYGEEFLRHINPVTKRVHSEFWQIVSTGRISSNKPNLQNIPNTEEYRHCFKGQGNRVLIVSDFSAQEQRVLADRCLDPALLEFYKNGDGDMH